MPGRFDEAIARFDRANAQDPNTVAPGNGERPAELVYAERMSETLELLYPDASESLRLAVRAQHLERWTIPRERYPEGRDGYRAWRNDAKRMHAERAGQILAACDYADDEIARVQALIRKEKLKRDPDAQALEDVACLVFLEHYFAGFAKKHDDAKLETILRKTWVKMSETARAAALELPLDGRLRSLVQKALAG